MERQRSLRVIIINYFARVRLFRPVISSRAELRSGRAAFIVALLVSRLRPSRRAWKDYRDAACAASASAGGGRRTIARSEGIYWPVYRATVGWDLRDHNFITLANGRQTGRRAGGRVQASRRAGGTVHGILLTVGGAAV